jgi:hypothetical protein
MKVRLKLRLKNARIQAELWWRSFAWDANYSDEKLTGSFCQRRNFHGGISDIKTHSRA